MRIAYLQSGWAVNEFVLILKALQLKCDVYA
jgi:hypothetical protein